MLHHQRSHHTFHQHSAVIQLWDVVVWLFVQGLLLDATKNYCIETSALQLYLECMSLELEVTTCRTEDGFFIYPSDAALQTGPNSMLHGELSKAQRYSPVLCRVMRKCVAGQQLLQQMPYTLLVDVAQSLYLRRVL